MSVSIVRKNHFHSFLPFSFLASEDFLDATYDIYF